MIDLNESVNFYLINNSNFLIKISLIILLSSNFSIQKKEIYVKKMIFGDKWRNNYNGSILKWNKQKDFELRFFWSFIKEQFLCLYKQSRANTKMRKIDKNKLMNELDFIKLVKKQIKNNFQLNNGFMFHDNNRKKKILIMYDK